MDDSQPTYCLFLFPKSIHKMVFNPLIAKILFFEAQYFYCFRFQYFKEPSHLLVGKLLFQVTSSDTYPYVIGNS